MTSQDTTGYLMVQNLWMNYSGLSYEDIDNSNYETGNKNAYYPVAIAQKFDSETLTNSQRFVKVFSY